MAKTRTAPFGDSFFDLDEVVDDITKRCRLATVLYSGLRETGGPLSEDDVALLAVAIFDTDEAGKRLTSIFEAFSQDRRAEAQRRQGGAHG